MLAEVGGLASQHDAFATAMQRVDQLEAFCGMSMTPAQRLGAFMQIFAAQIRASEAILPYVHGKVDKPAPAQMGVLITTAPAVQARPGDGARLVDHAPQGVEAVRWSPPPMPGKTVQNQEVD